MVVKLRTTIFFGLFTPSEIVEVAIKLLITFLIYHFILGGDPSPKEKSAHDEG